MKISKGKVTKKTPSAKKPAKKTRTAKKIIMAKVVEPALKKVGVLGDGTFVSKDKDGKLVITGKHAKCFEGAQIEQKERQYKFDDRLAPYYLGADSKDGNLMMRNALIALGKTPEMTQLFVAMKEGNFAYREDAKETFIKALYTIIRGHDAVGLAVVTDADIEAIHKNNLKTFNDFWNAKEKMADETEDDEFAGFSADG